MIRSSTSPTVLLLPVLCSLFVTSLSSTSPSLPPSGLTCNYQSSPVIGISTPFPIFRWQLPSVQLNQTAFQLQFFNEATNLLLFDTQPISSSLQQYTYNGPAFNSTTAYAWVVRTWNENNQPSDYSPPATFITGLLSTSDWTSAALWHPNGTTGFAFFRNTFTLPIPILRIHRILTFITANPQGSINGEIENSKLLGAYRLYINNQWIGMGPGRPGTCGPVCPVGGDPGVCFCSPEHIYEGYDITQAALTNLSSTDNTVTIAIQSFNYPPRTNNYAVNFTSKIASEFYILDTEGQIYHISSLENTWKSYNADAYFGQPACCVSDPGWYLQPTENINAILEPQNWRSMDYNDSEWVNAISLPNFATDTTVALVARPTSPLVITENVQPLSVLTLGPGHYFIDLGKEIQGGLRLSWDDSTIYNYGTTFQVRLGEELLTTDPPSVRYQMRTGNTYLNTWTLRNGSQTIEHHEYLEFRYVELIDTSTVSSTCVRTTTGDYTTPVTLSCGVPSGSSVITNILFADWGTPNGECFSSVSPYANNFTVNASCSYDQTGDVLSKLCVGKSSCTFTPSDQLFGNTDPCDKVYKWLAVVVNCSGVPPSPSHYLPLPSSISAWVLTYPAVYSTLSTDEVSSPIPGTRGPSFMMHVSNDNTSSSVRPHHQQLYVSSASLPSPPPTQLVASSAALNSVWNLCAYTVVATALDMYTDSNTRQRSVICAEALHINILMQFATSYEVSMQIYTLLYTINMRPSSLGWAEWQALTIYSVYTIYQYTGDLSLFIQNYDHLRYFTELSLIDNTTGLWTADDKTFNSNNPEIDWPSNMRDGFVFVPVDTVVNAYTYRAMMYFVEMAQAVGGHDNDVEFFTTVANRLRDAMNTVLFNPDLGYYRDGQGTNHTAWHSSVYALAFGIPTTDMIPSVLQYVVERSIGNQSLCQPGNVYPAQWALEAFYNDNTNHGLYGLQLLLCNGTNSWLALLAQNNTMTSEAWSPDEKPNETRSHSWTASPADIIPRFVLGVRPFLPGFAKLLIQPQVGTLEWINGVVPTIKGPVYINVTQNSTLNATLNKLSIHSMEISFTVPGNTNSLVCLPIEPCTIGMNEYGIVVDGTLVTTNLVMMDDSVCMDNVGAGQHTAVCAQ